MSDMAEPVEVNTPLIGTCWPALWRSDGLASREYGISPQVLEKNHVR